MGNNSFSISVVVGFVSPSQFVFSNVSWLWSPAEWWFFFPSPCCLNQLGTWESLTRLIIVVFSSVLTHFWDSGLGPSLCSGQGKILPIMWPRSWFGDLSPSVHFSHPFDNFLRQTKSQSHLHKKSWAEKRPRNENLWMKKVDLNPEAYLVPTGEWLS